MAGVVLGRSPAAALCPRGGCARQAARPRSAALGSAEGSPSSPASLSLAPGSVQRLRRGAPSGQREPTRRGAQFALRAAAGDQSSDSTSEKPAADAPAPAAPPAAAADAAEAQIPPLKTARLLTRSLALTWRSFRAGLIVSAAASLAEQIVSFVTFAIILLTGEISGLSTCARSLARRLCLSRVGWT